MKDSETIDEKKGLFAMVIEDLWHMFMVVIRALLAMVILPYTIVLPSLFLMTKILSVFFTFTSGLVANILALASIIFVVPLFFYWTSGRKNPVIGWIFTGRIEREVSDKNNRRMRALWLKAHRNKERTKPSKFSLNLDNKTSFYTFETIYPKDKYGHSEVVKAPVCYRAIVPVTHKFFGDLPVKGDVVRFSWKTTSNNDIKRIRVRAIEFDENNENMSDYKDLWRELDAAGTEGIVCAEGIKTGKKFKIQGTVKFKEKVKNKVQLCFWYLPDEAEGESVFRDNFN